MTALLGEPAGSDVGTEQLDAVSEFLAELVELPSKAAFDARGRTASIVGLDPAPTALDPTALGPTALGFLAVDASRTKVEHIDAGGDVIGSPALATIAIEQGSRAVRHALGLELGPAPRRSLPASTQSPRCPASV